MTTGFLNAQLQDNNKSKFHSYCRPDNHTDMMACCGSHSSPYPNSRFLSPLRLCRFRRIDHRMIEDRYLSDVFKVSFLPSLTVIGPCSDFFPRPPEGPKISYPHYCAHCEDGIIGHYSQSLTTQMLTQSEGYLSTLPFCLLGRS